MRENTIDLRGPLLCADHRFSVTPMSSGIRLGGTVEFAGLEAPANPKRWEIMTKRARVSAWPPHAVGKQTSREVRVGPTADIA
jgi:hypothetical protein